MSKTIVTIFHNPRCSKSRNALMLLKKNGIEPTVLEYLKTPPTKSELQDLLKKLGMKPEQIVRKGEEIYKEKYAGRTMTDEQWLDVLTRNPILIERPIVVRGERAVIGRPPENVLTLALPA